VCCEFLIVLYFGTVSWCNDNILGIDFDSWWYVVLRYSVWLLIAVNNSFIVPRIAKHLVKKVFVFCATWNREQKLRRISVTASVLRSLNLVYIPMLLLIIMHNDCARYNNAFWSKCRDEHAQEFVFEIGTEKYSIQQSVCDYGFLRTYAMDYGKCTRSVLEEWAIIIVFSAFGYVCCMLGFWLYSVSRYHLTLKRQYESRQRTVGSLINVEYAEIWNHVQIVVIFGCSMPFVIPLIAFVLLVNKWVYQSLLTRKFRLSDVNPYFPARLLILTNAMQQILIIAFVVSNHMKGRYLVIAGDLFVDLVFIVWWYWYRNKISND